MQQLGGVRGKLPYPSSKLPPIIQRGRGVAAFLGRGGFLVGAWIIGKGESCLPSPSCLPYPEGNLEG